MVAHIVKVSAQMFLLSLGLAVSAVAIQPYNSEVPGSVIVFPKFIKGVSQTGEANSEFEISVRCPEGLVCPEGQRVKIKAHWVCPGDEDSICDVTDFDLFTTVFGSLLFSPSNVNLGKTPSLPPAPNTLTPGGIVRVPVPPLRQGLPDRVGRGRVGSTDQV